MLNVPSLFILVTYATWPSAYGYNEVPPLNEIAVPGSGIKSTRSPLFLAQLAHSDPLPSPLITESGTP